MLTTLKLRARQINYIRVDAPSGRIIAIIINAPSQDLARSLVCARPGTEWRSGRCTCVQFVLAPPAMVGVNSCVSVAAGKSAIARAW